MWFFFNLGLFREFFRWKISCQKLVKCKDFTKMQFLEKNGYFLGNFIHKKTSSNALKYKEIA